MLYFIKLENWLSHQAFIFLHHRKLQTLPGFYHFSVPSKPIFFLLLCLIFTPASQTGNSRFGSHWISEDERASTEPRYQSCPSTTKLVSHYPQESKRKYKPHQAISLPHERKGAQCLPEFSGAGIALVRYHQQTLSCSWNTVTLWPCCAPKAPVGTTASCRGCWCSIWKLWLAAQLTGVIYPSTSGWVSCSTVPAAICCASLLTCSCLTDWEWLICTFSCISAHCL